MDSQSGDASQPIRSASGIWHLVDDNADEIDIPQHRMDVLIREDAGQLSGAILSRVSGEEMPLVRVVTFDGEVLRLQLKPPPDRSQADMPFLVMRLIGNKFEGTWVLRGTPVGPGLKLVRQRSETK